VLSVAIYDLLLAGQFRALSALAILQIGLTLGMLALARWVFGLDRMPGK
jgi:ABC-type Fe3+ transport system permease subunit